MAIFVLMTTTTTTRPITLPLAHVRRVMIMIESVHSICRDGPDTPIIYMYYITNTQLELYIVHTPRTASADLAAAAACVSLPT